VAVYVQREEGAEGNRTFHYSEFAQAAAATDPEQAHGLAATFKGNQQLAVLPAKEQRERSSAAFRAYAQNVLADDRLTEEEEAAFGDVAEALGVDQTEFATTFNDVLNRLVIARVNDGRLGEIAQPQLMTKKGEVVHLQTNANLMKEVALRDWRGGTSGVSFRVAKGVSYRTGAIRGKSVVVGAELQVADSGVLAVTPTPRSSVSTQTLASPT
jgi:hypothetical protein